GFFPGTDRRAFPHVTTRGRVVLLLSCPENFGDLINLAN
ncbi:MAG: hypothetical protein RJB59_420, partial [Actinomycetota bacterium]